MSATQKEILGALENQFASSVRTIYINSTKQEVGFREPTTKEIKTISKIMIEHENDEVTLYEASLALITSLILDKESFNSSELTEFDRIKILMCITSDNFNEHPLSIKCKKCDHSFKIDFDYEKFILQIDDIDLTEKLISMENKNHTMQAYYTYPKCSEVLKFLKKKKTLEKDKSKEQLTIIDYFYLFITRLILTNKSTSDSFDLYMNQCSDITEVISIIEKFPSQFIMNSVVTKIKSEFESLNKISDGSTCPSCSEPVEITFGGSNGFF